MFHRLFVLILIGSLVLPAVPVSGCECGEKQTSQSSSCCCCTQANKQPEQPQPKSCCCKTAKTEEKQAPAEQKQLNCQQNGCQCQHSFSQPATATSVKSVELAQQLRCNWDLIDLTAPLSPATRPATSQSRELHTTEVPCSAEEHCAHFCLWLI